MLTPARIARLANAQDWDILLREVLANGRPLPGAAVERLREPTCVRAAAAALGLCRTLELTRRPVRSPGHARHASDASDCPLLTALREGASSSDPVAAAFAVGALRAVGEPCTIEERAGDFSEGEASSEEGSPLDALLTVWALGGLFVSAPNALVERPDLSGRFERAARAVRGMDQRSPLAADLRSMLALASIALRRVAGVRHAA